MAVLGMWMWSRSIRLRGAEDVISHCADAGVTDIYFLVKGLLGTAAYKSSLVPMDGERDLLAEALNAAHKRGIRLHAWFTTACDEQYVTGHPESGRFHCRKGPDNQMVSLADEGYRLYMEAVVQEICRNYPIDGLHLDYIRYNHITSGWSDTELQCYAAEGADTDKLWEMLNRMYYQEQEKDENLLFDAYRTGEGNAVAFANARRKQVVQFARRLREAAKAEKSDLMITAALMPEGAYEDPTFADLHYGQNYTDAAGLYDYVMPMAYTNSYGKDGVWLQKLAKNSTEKGLKTVMGLQAFSPSTGVSLRDDIAALQNVPNDGICLFREGSCVTAYRNNRKLTVYNATEGNVTRIAVARGDEKAEWCTELNPGMEIQLDIPFIPDTVQAFNGDKEICVFTADAK